MCLCDRRPLSRGRSSSMPLYQEGPDHQHAAVPVFVMLHDWHYVDDERLRRPVDVDLVAGLDPIRIARLASVRPVLKVELVERHTSSNRSTDWGPAAPRA